MADQQSNCRHVRTQAELDAALKAKPKPCIHVQADAEASVLEWQTANTVEPKKNGEW